MTNGYLSLAGLGGRAALIEHDDAEVLNGYGQCLQRHSTVASSFFESLWAMTRTVNAVALTTPASPDFPVGHLLTTCEEQRE